MTPDGTRPERAATAPLADETGQSGADHASRGSWTGAPTADDAAPRVVLVLEFALNPKADPNAVERAVRDYVRRLQASPAVEGTPTPLVHAAIDNDARRVLAVFGR